MEILDEKRLHEKMWKAYDNQPIGWKYFFGKDKNGNYTSPYGKDHICVGIRAGIDDEELSNMTNTFFDMEFGVRPVNLSKEEVSELMKGNRTVLMKEVEEIEKSMQQFPVPRDEVETSVVTVTGLYQPLNIQNLEDISPSQKELSNKMEEELKRLERIHLNYIS
jgi:hypothetical protein